MSKWIDINIELPPEGVYVLIRHNKNNWFDHNDQEGLRFRVAKMTKGISKAEREKLPTYTSAEDLENFKAGLFIKWLSLAEHTFQFGDEYDNNLKPYAFDEFGQQSYFGQEITHWQHINRKLE